MVCATPGTSAQTDPRIVSTIPFNASANISTTSSILPQAAAAPSLPSVLSCGDTSYRSDVPFIRFSPSTHAGPSLGRVRAHTASPVPRPQRAQYLSTVPEAPASAPSVPPRNSEGPSGTLELHAQDDMTSSHDPPPSSHIYRPTSAPAVPERLRPGVSGPLVELGNDREGAASATTPSSDSPTFTQSLAVDGAEAPPVAGPSGVVLEPSPVNFPGCPTAEYVESEADLLAPIDWERYRDSRGIRGGGETVWYRTSGPFALSYPPASLTAHTDDIYIHRDVGTSRVKIWVLNRARMWVSARAGDPQPSDSSRRLSVSKSGDPSWITKASYGVYRSRVKRARRLDQGHPPTVSTSVIASRLQ